MALRHPVTCKQIGRRPIYLGSARAAQKGTVEVEFEHVVTLSSSRQPLTTEFIPLSESSKLSYEQFSEAVETVRECFRSGARTLVHCEVGISRSAAVIATALACEDETSFEQALAEIKQYRQRASPRRPLRESAKRYMQNEQSSSKNHMKYRSGRSTV